MYELFTDQLRNVMRLANQQAQQFNHEYLGTEHILLGLVREDKNIAVDVLKNLNVDLRQIQPEIEKIIPVGLITIVTMGKLPQTPRAKNVIYYATEEARELNQNHVGPEHMLLGLLRETEGVAYKVLTNLGLTLEEVRHEILILTNPIQKRC